MFFGGAFVVGCAPSSNAFETKSVVARVENAELLSLRENRFQTNLALFIVLLDVGLLFGRTGEVAYITALRMQILTLVAVPALSIYEVLTNHLFLVAVNEMLNQGVFVVLKIFQYRSWYFPHYTKRLDRTLLIEVLVQY